MYRKIILLLVAIGCLTLPAIAASKQKKQFTLVIDAGHGGHDAGAVGAVTKEKNLTLRHALAFGRLVEKNCPDVKVIYTRKTDQFVELYRRAEIANKAKADLFISVHINSLPKGKTARGFQTYTLGASRRTGKKNGVVDNLEVAKRENSVIYLEKDYKQTYHGYDPNSPESNIMFEFIQDKNMENSVELAKYMQRYVCQATGRQNMGAHQDNLAVLRLSSMPGCLVELGFISTRDEEQFMNSAAAEEKYARGMFNAFLAYRKKHGGNITIPYQPAPETEEVSVPSVVPEEAKQEAEQQASEPQDTEPEPQETEPPAPAPQDTIVAPVFKVQILASSSKLKNDDSRLKGVAEVSSYEEGGLHKYTVGASEDYSEISRLRRELSEKFPQAFIVAFRGDSRMDVNEAIREYQSRKKKK